MAVRRLLGLRERSVARALVMHAAVIALVVQVTLGVLRPIGAVGPDGCVSIAGIDQLTQDSAVMDRSIGSLIAADEWVLVIDSAAVLVAVIAVGVLFRPARLAVFLAQLLGLVLPVWRDFARIDQLGFFPAVTLPRRRHDRRIDNRCITAIV